jgi:hypothetical protein
MKTTVPLLIASLLSIVLLTLHLADDVVLGKDVLDITRLSIYLPVIAVWLYATLLLTERRSGHIIVLLGAPLGLAVVAIHASGATGIHGEFFHVWLLIAMGSASLFSLILAVIGLISQYKTKESRAADL